MFCILSYTPEEGVPEWRGLDGALCIGEKAVDNTSPALPWPNRSVILGSPKCSIPFTDSSAPSWFPMHYQHACPLSPAVSEFADWHSVGVFPSCLHPLSAQLGRHNPASSDPSSSWVAPLATMHPPCPPH